jgi:hypothetical protein
MLTPRIKEKDDGTLQWSVIVKEEEALMTGWKCDIQLEPVGDNGSRTKVASHCEGLQSSKSPELDALISRALTKQDT